MPLAPLGRWCSDRGGGGVNSLARSRASPDRHSDRGERRHDNASQPPDASLPDIDNPAVDHRCPALSAEYGRAGGASDRRPHRSRPRRQVCRRDRPRLLRPRHATRRSAASAAPSGAGPTNFRWHRSHVTNGPTEALNNLAPNVGRNGSGRTDESSSRAPTRRAMRAAGPADCGWCRSTDRLQSCWRSRAAASRRPSPPRSSNAPASPT